MQETKNKSTSYRFDSQNLLKKIIICDIDAAIKLIINDVTTIENKELKHSLILFCYDCNWLKKQVDRGVIKKEDEFFEERKIVDRLLQQILRI